MAQADAVTYFSSFQEVLSVAQADAVTYFSSFQEVLSVAQADAVTYFSSFQEVLSVAQADAVTYFSSFQEVLSVAQADAVTYFSSFQEVLSVAHVDAVSAHWMHADLYWCVRLRLSIVSLADQLCLDVLPKRHRWHALINHTNVKGEQVVQHETAWSPQFLLLGQ